MKIAPLTYMAVAAAFLVNSFGPLPMAQANEFILPRPGVMVHLSPQFNPPVLKGIKIHTNNPFSFDFILNKGDSPLADDQLKQESNKLIKYFLASLTVPEKDLWVNLSPYEKERIIPQSFGLTEMGRDLLAEDYMLKQITASLIYPEDEFGKKFWQRVYEQAVQQYGTTNIPMNTFNKVWIVPEKAVIYENAQVGAAYVIESKLKVMLEQDYLALQKNTLRSGGAVQPSNKVSSLGSQIVREIVIPQLTKEVNEGKNFVQLRQVYQSLILAAWYKKKVKDSILSHVYVDKSKVSGVRTSNPQEKEKIYQRYLQAFKKGVYNYIKEETDPATQQIIPRKYFSGGVAVFGYLDRAMSSTSDSSQLPQTSNEREIAVNVVPERQGMSYEDAKSKGLVRDDEEGEFDPSAPAFRKWFDEHAGGIRNQLNMVETVHTQVGLSPLQTHLLLSKNELVVKTSEAIQSAFAKGKQIIVEIGSGNTANALELARNNPQALVIATDEYDSNPETALPDYLPYATDFEAGSLPAQKAKLDNLVVVRSFADILLYLPDNSVGNIVFVQPPRAAMKDLIVLVNEFDVLKKLKPGARIAVLAKDSVKDYLDLVKGDLHFEKQDNETFLNVDVGKNSAWKEDFLQGGLYIAAKSMPAKRGILNRLLPKRFFSAVALAVAVSSFSGQLLAADRSNTEGRAIISTVPVRGAIVNILQKNATDNQKLQRAKEAALSKVRAAIENAKRRGSQPDLRVLNVLYAGINSLSPQTIQIFSVQTEDKDIELNAFTDYKNPAVSLDHLADFTKLVSGLIHENLHPVIHDMFQGISEDDEETRVIAMTLRIVGKQIEVKFERGQNGEYTTSVHSLDPNLSTEEMNAAIRLKADEELKQTTDAAYRKFLQSIVGGGAMRKDKAMSGPNGEQDFNKGGIDLNSDKMNLQVQNNGAEIKFQIDAAMIQQLRNVPGFMPVIINIQPLTNLKAFLGVSTPPAVQTAQF